MEPEKHPLEPLPMPCAAVPYVRLPEAAVEALNEGKWDLRLYLWLVRRAKRPPPDIQRRIDTGELPPGTCLLSFPVVSPAIAFYDSGDHGRRVAPSAQELRTTRERLAMAGWIRCETGVEARARGRTERGVLVTVCGWDHYGAGLESARQWKRGSSRQWAEGSSSHHEPLQEETDKGTETRAETMRSGVPQTSSSYASDPPAAPARSSSRVPPASGGPVEPPTPSSLTPRSRQAASDATWAMDRVLALWNSARAWLATVQGATLPWTPHRTVPKQEIARVKAILSEAGSQEAFEEEVIAVLSHLLEQRWWTVETDQGDWRPRLRSMLAKTKWEERRDHGALCSRDWLEGKQEPPPDPVVEELSRRAAAAYTEEDAATAVERFRRRFDRAAAGGEL